MHLKISAPVLSINTMHQERYILTLIPQIPKAVTDLILQINSKGLSKLQRFQLVNGGSWILM